MTQIKTKEDCLKEYIDFDEAFTGEETNRIFSAMELYASQSPTVSATLEERAKELYPIDYSEKRLTNATEFDIEQQMKLNEKHLAQQQAFLAGASCQQNRCGRWVKSDKNFPAEKGYYFIKELGGGKKVVWFDRVVYDRDGENSVCWTDGKNNYSGYEFESWLDESSPCLCDVYRGALEKIAAQKVEAGETKIDYAFNRNWHIATTALSTK